MPLTLPTPPGRIERLLRAEACRRSYATFIQEFWGVIEPGTPLAWNWHIQAIADHLQAVTENRISRLMIAIPPGHGKSIFTSVLWQPWQWLHNPSLRELYGSYDESLTYRDSLRARDVIKSPKYQQMFSPDWFIRHDQDSKGFFINSRHGSRRTYYVGSRKITGWRGDHVVIDDPLSAKSRYDRLIKSEVIDTYDRVLSTRVNNPNFSAFVVIMQRLASDDLIGHILEKYEDEYEYLMLPAEFDPDRRCVTSIFKDKRTEAGELLFPQMYPKDRLEALKVQLGQVDADAQLQHLPHPEGGARFNTSKFQYWRWIGSMMIELMHRSGAVEHYRVDLMPKFITVDVACSEKRGSDYTVIGLWAITNKNEIILLHRRRLQQEEAGVVANILEVYHMQEYGRLQPMWVGIEDTGVGLPIKQAVGTKGLPVTGIHATKDLITNSSIAIVRIEAGQIFFPAPDVCDWVREFTDFLVKFPGASNDDDVSMVSLAANSMYEKTVPVFGKIDPKDPKMSIGPQAPQHKVTGVRADLTRTGRKMFGVVRGGR